MSEPTFSVVTDRGHYDWLHPKDEQVCVRVTRPGHELLSFTVGTDSLRQLRDGERWSEYLVEACETFLRRYISSQGKQIQALLEWVKDEANARALDTVQAERRVSQLRESIELKQQELARAERDLASLQRAAA